MAAKVRLKNNTFASARQPIADIAGFARATPPPPPPLVMGEAEVVRKKRLREVFTSVTINVNRTKPS